MIRIIKDPKYGYKTIFNTKTGSYVRFSDELMASFPHLIDIGIMGNCQHGHSGLCLKSGVQCYQNGLHKNNPNMCLDDYKSIINEIKDKCFQVSLGGRGDPDMHENFEEILEYSCRNHVIPNFTTSGLGMTPEKASICKAYCGAVAVSQYSRIVKEPFVAIRLRNSSESKTPYMSVDDIPVMFTLNNMNNDCYIDGRKYVIHGKDFDWKHQKYLSENDLLGEYELYRVYEEKQEPNYTFHAIDMLLKAGVTTNIHYVLGKNTIDEAILRLKHGGFPHGINAVIFLLHKPVGLGTSENVLQYDDPRLIEFFKLVDEPHDYQIGFDSCTIPGILNFSKNINPMSIDSCEAGRFSMYIDANMIAYPCSFDNMEGKYAYSLKSKTIQDAWDSEQFEVFRNKMFNSCPNCQKQNKCLGGCPLTPSVVLCKERMIKNDC